MPVQTENDYSSRKETPTPRRAFSKPVCASKERDALMTAKALLLPATTDAMYTQLWDSFLVNKRVSQILYLAVPGKPLCKSVVYMYAANAVTVYATECWLLPT